jgi:tight adherence protein B
VYAIGIGGPSFSPGTLQRLARATGGSYHRAVSTSALGDVYTSLQDELARTWQVTYDTTARPGARLRVTAVIAGAVVHATAVLPTQSDTAPEPATGLLPAAAYDTVGTLVLGLLVGGLVLLACGFWFAVGRGARLRSRLAPHLGTATRAPKTRRRETRAAARSRLADAIERVLADVRQFRKVERMIERADMPLRAAELLVVCAGSAVVLALLTAVAGAPALVVFAFLFVGFAIPLGYVASKASARVKRMENQLPDLLITLAAALKAGHSFRQGIQSVVDEGAEPAASEFKRVLAETQLGKPMDEALVDLAERVGSKNFSFVVTAVTIQRQIGGSLAGLFDMVADTVRQRQQFQRKIRGLTAMGRMSAYVLVGLPFLIGAVISVMNPLYMAPLYHTKTGHELIIIGLVMISVGTVLLRKIVAFKG